jgi:hypothetical protein
MKKYLHAVIVIIIATIFLSLPAIATRKEGITGVVENINPQKITIAGKSYRIGNQFRVVVVTRKGIHRSENAGRQSDVRIGDKVSAVVLYDEITDIYLERY